MLHILWFFFSRFFADTLRSSRYNRIAYTPSGSRSYIPFCSAMFIFAQTIGLSFICHFDIWIAERTTTTTVSNMSMCISERNCMRVCVCKRAKVENFNDFHFDLNGNHPGQTMPSVLDAKCCGIALFSHVLSYIVSVCV